MKIVQVTSQKGGVDFRGNDFFDYEFNNGCKARASFSGLHVLSPKGYPCKYDSKNYKAVERAVLAYQFQYGV